MSIENQISEYNGKLLQRNGLMANSSTVNPLVMDMDEVLAELRKAIIASIDNQYHKLEMQIGSLQKTKVRLRHILRQIQAKLSSCYLLNGNRK